MNNLCSFVIDNIKTAFESLPQKGTNEQFKHLRYFKNIGVEHVQGYAQCTGLSNKNYLFTHHTVGNYGYLLMTTSIEDNNPSSIPLENGWNHPGGIQTIGQYVFVPCERDKESNIFIYDVTNKSMVKSIKLDHRAGCIGITSYNNKYVVVIGDKETYHVYLGDIPQNMSELEIKKVSSFVLKDTTFKEVNGYKSGKYRTKSIDCQGFGLITSHPYDNPSEKQEVPYMIAPVYQDSEDWIYLIELDFSGSSFSMIPRICRHLKNDGGLAGEDGTHFRWGAGVVVTSDSKLMILATSRNIVYSGVTRLNTNYWVSD